MPAELPVVKVLFLVVSTNLTHPWSFHVNKTALLQQLKEHLAARMDAFERSARATHEEATHEQNKAENKYDTRALEASYLAQGQTRQALEVIEALEELERFSCRDFLPADPIAPGALVELEGVDGNAWYFLVPFAGGTELAMGGVEVLVLNPNSPLGQALNGRKGNEKIRLQLGRQSLAYRVKSVL